jgi:hypothetical protein
MIRTYRLHIFLVRALGIMLAVLGLSAHGSGYVPTSTAEQRAALAMRKEFKGVCRVNNGSGVFIAPNAVLTAKHLFTQAKSQRSVSLDGRKLKVAAVHKKMWADLAVVILSEPVLDVVPTPIYRGNNELGMTVWKVGYDDWRPPGDLRPRTFPRVFTNDISKVSEKYLFYKFDMSGSGHTEFEGVNGPGDSGGPLYANVDGTWFVVGVTSISGMDFNADIRVSTKAEWIDEAIRKGIDYSTTGYVLCYIFIVLPALAFILGRPWKAATVEKTSS